MTTLIVTPLADERTALVSALEALGWAMERRTVGPLDGHVAIDHAVMIVEGGHGKTRFAVHTRYLLDALPDVHRVVCAGAAGALQMG